MEAGEDTNVVMIVKAVTGQLQFTGPSGAARGQPDGPGASTGQEPQVPRLQRISYVGFQPFKWGRRSTSFMLSFQLKSEAWKLTYSHALDESIR